MWGLFVRVLGHGGLVSIWMALTAGAVIGAFALLDVARGKWKDAGCKLVAVAGLSVPWLIGLGLCRLYAHVMERDVTGWLWVSGGVLLGALIGLGAAKDISNQSRSE